MHSHIWDFGQIEKAAYQSFVIELGSAGWPSAPFDLLNSKLRLQSPAETACSVLSFASLILPMKVEEGPQQWIAVSIDAAVTVVVVALEEERMVYLGQQHYENKVVVVVAAAVVVKDSTI